MVILNRQKVRTLRRAKSLTQEQLAEYCGISDRYLRSLETQKISPSALVLYRLSKALDTPMDDLIYDDGRQDT